MLVTKPMAHRKQRNGGGFSFVELLAAVAIVSLLATIALPLASLSVTRGKESELRRALRDIRAAIDAYKQAAVEGRVTVTNGASGYPPSLEILAEGVQDDRNPGGRLYFLRRIPRDPFFSDLTTVPAQTWGLRSYASSAESPRPGADVYDIYSTSEGVGLNGVPYRQW